MRSRGSGRVARIVVMLGFVLVHHLHAQTPAGPHVIGTWRGTSLCLVRPSACRDENVVYRVMPTSAADSVTLDARKIINGAEEEMGVLGCRFTAPNASLTCAMRNGVWRFTVRGDSLVGELRLPDGTKFRDVRTVRVAGGRTRVGSTSANGRRRLTLASRKAQFSNRLHIAVMPIILAGS